MEFEGRIAKVLPTRSGTKQDGNEWRTLPFIFEYFENETDRYPDSVLLETFDHDIMRKIGQFVVKGADKKAVIKDGCCELTQEIKCRCGFSHKVNTFKKRDGSGDGMMNNLRAYKLEILTEANAAGTVAQAPVQPQMAWPQQQPQNFPPQQTEGESDDLPF